MSETEKKESLKDKRENLERKQEETIERLHRISEEEEASRRAQKLGFPYIDLSIIPIESETVAILPEEQARKGLAAVIQKAGKNLRLAVLDPQNSITKEVMDKLKKEQGFNLKIFVVSRASLEKAWKCYRTKILSEVREEQKIYLKEEELTEFEKGMRDITELKQRITEISTTEVLNIIIAGAIKMDASDIHLEPYEKETRLRYRIDGVLHDIVQFSKRVYPLLLSRIKMLGKMKLHVHDIPQNGRFSIDINHNLIDVRIAVLPGNYGESIVMRLLSQKATALDLEVLGLNQDALEKTEKALVKPTGMILTVGPTGCGKTTTLYAFIKKINNPEIKIITLEDPIEYRINGIAQTQVETDRGYTFNSGLRAILRQDPDVIMIGEIRDSETANTAIQAALTGHVVFSTLHANNAAGVIPRLIELRVKPSLIPPAINLIIGQRLVRRLCKYCREEYKPADETVEKIKKILAKAPPKTSSGVEIPKTIETFWRAKGCSKCNFIGYRGRIGIFEMFSINTKVEKLILEQAPASQIAEVLQKQGMITMAQDGILKALRGITSLEEVKRVTGE